MVNFHLVEVIENSLNKLSYLHRWEINHQLGQLGVREEAAAATEDTGSRDPNDDGCRVVYRDGAPRGALTT